MMITITEWNKKERYHSLYRQSQKNLKNILKLKSKLEKSQKMSPK